MWRGKRTVAELLYCDLSCEMRQQLFQLRFELHLDVSTDFQHGRRWVPDQIYHYEADHLLGDGTYWYLSLQTHWDCAVHISIAIHMMYCLAILNNCDCTSRTTNLILSTFQYLFEVWGHDVDISSSQRRVAGFRQIWRLQHRLSSCVMSGGRAIRRTSKIGRYDRRGTEEAHKNMIVCTYVRDHIFMLVRLLSATPRILQDFL